MSGRPKFRDGVYAVVLNESLVALDAGSGIELLEGPLSSALAHGLNGDIASAPMIAQPDGALETMEAVYEIDTLRRRGLLAPDPSAAALTPDASAAALTIDESPVALPIVETADYLDPQLEEVNRRALESGQPWMLARPRGTTVWIGPVLVPGRGPCWACMAARLRAVRAAWRLPELRAEDGPVSRLALDLAALEAARWKRQPHRTARLVTFDTLTLAQREHVIVRRRDCAACGDPATKRDSAPLVLQSRAKTFTLDGGHRAAPPEQTYARYEHLVSPLAGVVHEVRRADGDFGSLTTFAARHNFLLGGGTPATSYGKGMTVDQARTGALCEALERYSGVYRGDEPVVRAAFRDLGDDAVHPHACLGISERQYRARAEWNRTMGNAMWLPEELDEEAETGWVPAWSLTHARTRHVAAAYCYFGYPRETNHFANADSNGSAAGTCIEDAILQGLLELIERDAAGIWWYSRAHRPAAAADSPYVRAMTREHAAHGQELRLLDLTTDLGIPVCAAIAAGPKSFCFGFGAHLDPGVAVSRAVSEVNQLFALNRWKGRLHRGHLHDRGFLEPHGQRELTTAVPPSNDLRDDVLALTGVLERHGLEVLVVDQTRADVGLPVVKVLVPGLRHFRPRFAPGRLYDVPSRLGWTERALTEDDLNPAHLIL